MSFIEYLLSNYEIHTKCTCEKEGKLWMKRIERRKMFANSFDFILGSSEVRPKGTRWLQDVTWMPLHHWRLPRHRYHSATRKRQSSLLIENKHWERECGGRNMWNKYVNWGQLLSSPLVRCHVEHACNYHYNCVFERRAASLYTSQSFGRDMEFRGK